MAHSAPETQYYLRLSELLQRLMRSLHTQTYRYALRHELTLSECHTLFLLQHSKPVEMHTLKNNMCISGAFTTNIINRLVKYKLVKRQYSTNDRRKVTVVLTSKGKDCVKQLKEYNQTLLKSWFDDLQEKDKELLEQGIEILVTSLESMK